MFGARYWGRHFGPPYWGRGAARATDAPQGHYWGARYSGARYWGARYWPGAGAGVVVPALPPLAFGTFDGDNIPDDSDPFGVDPDLTVTVA